MTIKPFSKTVSIVLASIAISAVAITGATNASAATKPKPKPTPTATAAPAPAADPNKFSLALIGDMPYDANGQAQTPAVIDAINASGVDFSLFDGDTMSGKGDLCTDGNYARIKSDFFDKFNKPVFYSIGDNEWTDCDRPVKGAYDPNERLAKVRSLFFKDANGNYITLGKGALAGVQIQHDPNYPELQLFTYKKITFIVPHIPGSADNAAVTSDKYKTYNDLAKDGDATEYAARDAADVAWIQKGFKEAADKGSNGVIIVEQANLDWEGYVAGTAAPNNEFTAAFDNVKQAILTGTLAFKKPVLVQNGDEHWYQVDMPMNETSGKLVQRDKGSLVETFTRVQTFGSGFNHWVQLDIDPSNPLLWTITPKLIPANFAKH
jgi:hypothetical protein